MGVKNTEVLPQKIGEKIIFCESASMFIFPIFQPVSYEMGSMIGREVVIVLKKLSLTLPTSLILSDPLKHWGL